MTGPPYEIEVTVKKVTNCEFGLKEGDKIYFDGRTIKGEICYGALLNILPDINSMRWGVNFPWAKENGDVIEIACPDPENPTVFEIRRIRK